MCIVCCVSSLLGDDDDDLTAGCDVGQIFADEVRGVAQRHVFEDVGKEQRVKFSCNSVLGITEVFHRIGDTAATSGNINGRLARVNSDAVAI